MIYQNLVFSFFINGNIHHNIGGQVWMDENLKTTKYNDSNAIPNVEGVFECQNPSTDGAFCWYNNVAANKTVHGALYPIRV